MSATFDPTKHLRQLRGRGGTADYLDVKWRLVWLRAEHPDAITEVEHVEISPDIAIFKAQVMIPGQGRAVDYGSETPKDFGDYIEKAATKALGRALAQLGYGTQFVGFELDENTRIVDSPVDRKRQPEDDDGHAASQASNQRPAFTNARPARFPSEGKPAETMTLEEVKREIAPLEEQARRNDDALSNQEYARYNALDARRKALLAAQPRAAQATPVARAGGGDEPVAIADDWTAFWSWARARDYKGKHDMAVALGKTDTEVNNLGPAALRAALEVAHQRAG
jgi:hypothetical protein